MIQRLPIVFIVAIVLVLCFYYQPLRNLIFPGEKPSPTVNTSEKEEDEFNKLHVELYAAGIKLDNLRGKIALFKMAEKNRDWFKTSEYQRLPILLAQAETELKEAETEYERLKTKYAQETVRKLIAEDLNRTDTEKKKP